MIETWGASWKLPIMVLDRHPNRSLNLAPFPVRHVLADLHVSEIRSWRSEAIWRSTMAVLRSGTKTHQMSKCSTSTSDMNHEILVDYWRDTYDGLQSS